MNNQERKQKDRSAWNESCSRKQQEDPETGSFYRAVVESAGKAIICIAKDLNGTIRTWNQSAEKVYGYSAEEAVGKHISLLIPPDRRDDARKILDAVRRGTAVDDYETVRLRKDGAPVVVSLSASPIRDGTGAIIGASIVAVDITERKRKELELREAKELGDALNRINALIFSTRDADEIMQRVVVEAAKAVGADYAAVYVPEAGHWRARYVYGLPEAVQNRQFSEEDIKYSIKAVTERRIVKSNNIPGSSEFCNVFITEYGVQALIDAPLVIEDEVIGNFAVYSCKPGEAFTDQHSDFLVKVSASVGLAIRNSMLFSALDRARERAGFFSNAIEHSSQPFAAGKSDGSLIAYNQAYMHLTGYTAEELKSRTWATDLTPPEWRKHEEDVLKALHETGEPQLYEKEYIRKDGSRIPIEVKVHLMNDVRGGSYYYYSFINDITDRKKTEAALRESEARFREAFARAAIGMVLTDAEGRFLYANRAYQQIVNYSEEELRRPEMDFLGLTHPDDLPRNIELAKRLLSGEIPAFFVEKRYIRKDGGTVWVRVSTSLRRDEKGRTVQMVAMVENIDDRKRLEQEITHMAQHDPLTGLPNRRLFDEVAAVEVAQSRRHRKKLAIFFLDLDRFKEVNDTFGHAVGDRLLREAAARLRSAIRTSDTVARIGGDEFNLIITDIERAEDASEVARKILPEIRKPFLIDGHELNVSASIGISVFPDDSEEVETLLRYADIAMYYAKEHGRNRLQFYNPVINTRSLERVRFENSLRAAIEREELKLFFQPLVDIGTGKMVCAEALVRWQHPEQGLLLPEQFFGAAEDIGLMTEIDEWVLRKTGRQISAWQREGFSRVCVTVNLSAREFQNPALVGLISGMLSESGLVPDCLDVEITETTAMEDIDHTIERVNQLRAMGVQVSIDDFGTGYSSLSQLKRLPIQKLKIDKSFVRDIVTDADDRAIVNAVLLMAHSMKLRVVAEGVEGEPQLSFLRELNCDEAQGFFFSEPVPAEKMRDLLAA